MKLIISVFLLTILLPFQALAADSSSFGGQSVTAEDTSGGGGVLKTAAARLKAFKGRTTGSCTIPYNLSTTKVSFSITSSGSLRVSAYGRTCSAGNITSPTAVNLCNLAGKATLTPVGIHVTSPKMTTGSSGCGAMLCNSTAETMCPFNS